MREATHHPSMGLDPAPPLHRSRIPPVLLWAFSTVFLSTTFDLTASPQTTPLPGSAGELARAILENEVAQQEHDAALWSYHLVREQDGDQKTYLACQTKDGEIRRLIAINGSALTAAQQDAEDKRVEALIDHTDHIRAARRKEQEDGTKARKLMKSLPDAFLFQYEDRTASLTERNSLVRLRFRPNPKFRPSGQAETVFHHMEGELIVDVRQRRLKELRGHLTSEVKFLGGLLGHLERGGTFLVTQEDLGDGRWEMDQLNVQMNGKALFFKTIAVRQKEVFSDYQLQPPKLGPRQAIAKLFREPSRAALLSR